MQNLRTFHETHRKRSNEMEDENLRYGRRDELPCYGIWLRRGVSERFGLAWIERDRLLLMPAHIPRCNREI